MWLCLFSFLTVRLSVLPPLCLCGLRRRLGLIEFYGLLQVILLCVLQESQLRGVIFYFAWAFARVKFPLPLPAVNIATPEGGVCLAL